MPNFHVLCASSQDILTSRTSRPIPDLLAKTIASLDILVIVLPRSHSGRLSQATSTLVGLHSNSREPARGAQATCDNFGYAKGFFVSKRCRKPVKTATKRCCHVERRTKSRNRVILIARWNRRRNFGRLSESRRVAFLSQLKLIRYTQFRIVVRSKLSELLSLETSRGTGGKRCNMYYPASKC